jgi:multicomponent Na+:H+ antiporter subunit B
MFVGHNFFRSAVEFVHLPFIGELELVSAALFDLGVYFVVIGSLLFIFKSVGDDK